MEIAKEKTSIASKSADRIPHSFQAGHKSASRDSEGNAEQKEKNYFTEFK